MGAKHFVPSAPFVPARGVTSGHAQTVFGAIGRRPVPVDGCRIQRFETADDDFFDVEIVDGPANACAVVLLHGFEGSTQSGYIRNMLSLCVAHGYAAYALNFRGCSGVANRRAHSYNSGDTGDLQALLSWVRLRQNHSTLFAAGFSLGGNVLLKYLAETERPLIDAAAAACVPFDLQRCVRRIDSSRGIFPLYRRQFLPSLKAKATEKARLFPHELSVGRIRAVTTIEGFDDAVTAPLCGMGSAAEYYAWASSGPRLKAIRTPTLILSAADDPLAPAEFFPQEAWNNPSLVVSHTDGGGHVGFVGGSIIRPTWWAEDQIMHFFSRYAPT